VARSHDGRHHVTQLSVDELALGLQNQYGLDTETAYRRARAALGSLVQAPPTSVEIAEERRRADLAEKQEQNAIRKMALAIGFRVYWMSQARRTDQTRGVGDLWLSHRGRRFCAWWESKRQVGGTRSSEQIDFGNECISAGIPYGYGDRYAFARFLQAHGFTPPPFPRD
jgi:hypothetical protein